MSIRYELLNSYGRTFHGGENPGLQVLERTTQDRTSTHHQPSATMAQTPPIAFTAPPHLRQWHDEFDHQARAVMETLERVINKRNQHDQLPGQGASHAPTSTLAQAQLGKQGSCHEKRLLPLSTETSTKGYLGRSSSTSESDQCCGTHQHTQVTAKRNHRAHAGTCKR